MAEWRAGRSVGRTLYLDGKLVGLVDTAELAAEIVETMNGATVILALADSVERQCTDHPDGHADHACDYGHVAIMLRRYAGRPGDAQRRSEATPQNDLPPGPLNRSLHFGPSRVDPYDTNKGGVTDG